MASPRLPLELLMMVIERIPLRSQRIMVGIALRVQEYVYFDCDCLYIHERSLPSFLFMVATRPDRAAKVKHIKFGPRSTVSGLDMSSLGRGSEKVVLKAIQSLVPAFLDEFTGEFIARQLRDGDPVTLADFTLYFTPNIFSYEVLEPPMVETASRPRLNSLQQVCMVSANTIDALKVLKRPKIKRVGFKDLERAGIYSSTFDWTSSATHLYVGISELAESGLGALGCCKQLEEFLISVNDTIQHAHSADAGVNLPWTHHALDHSALLSMLLPSAETLTSLHICTASPRKVDLHPPSQISQFRALKSLVMHQHRGLDNRPAIEDFMNSLPGTLSKLTLYGLGKRCGPNSLDIDGFLTWIQEDRVAENPRLPDLDTVVLWYDDVARRTHDEEDRDILKYGWKLNVYSFHYHRFDFVTKPLDTPLGRSCREVGVNIFA